MKRRDKKQKNANNNPMGFDEEFDPIDEEYEEDDDEEDEQLITFSIAGIKGKILAAVATAAILIFVAVHGNLYLNGETEKGFALFMWSLIAAPVAGLLILIQPKVKEEYQKFANGLIMVLLPVLSIQMVECFNGNFIWNFSPKTFLANYITYLFFVLLLYLITKRVHMVGLISNIFLYVWSLINYFVEVFRGQPFQPMDILSAKTGMNVADGYNYELSWQLITGTIVFFLIYLINKKTVNVKAEKKAGKYFCNLVPAGFIAVVCLSFFFTDFSVNTGYKPDFWNQSRGYHKTGSFFNFVLNTKYLRVGKPSGYNAESIASIINNMLEDNGVDPDSDTSMDLLTGEVDYTASGETPNIIFIMNESWADLGNLGDLETNEDYMPYIHNLTENTIKGYVSVPVFGAGTSNSEFEALTGDSLSFMPAGSNVYQLYLKRETPSIVSSVKTLGYSATAYHPYYGSGWNRETVYPLLGFDDFISIEDFIDNDILETYKDDNNVTEYEDSLKERYPDKDMLLRRFVSDEYDYTMVEEMYEERDPDQPFFLFNVTMQNHGGYVVSYRNFYQQIYATNMSQEYPMANRYLSLVKETDSAFEELTEYFENVDEPTIICMFGDHLPSIEDEFYEELFGVDSLDDLTLEQQMKQYSTPFVIWANYDIEEAEVDTISTDYLSTLLMQTAGLPMTQYNKYLATLYQKLPVISTVVTEDSDGNLYASGEETPYDDLLNDYNCLVYNNLLDKKNMDESQFYLNTGQDEN